MQPQLRRLAHRADKQQYAKNGHRIEPHPGKGDGRSRHARCGFQDFRNRHGPEHQEGAKNPQHESQIADAIDDKSLDRGSIGAGLLEPETDQQVTCKPDTFPTEEHLHQIIRRHQHEHGEGKQREIGEEARLVRVFLHIAPAVEMDERRHRGHHHQHHGGQRVDAQRPVEIQAARLHPGQDRHDLGSHAATQETQEDRPAERAGDKQRAGGDRFGRHIAERAVAKTGDDGCQQRQENNEEDGLHAYPQSRSC